MFERFTDAARATVNGAQTEARQLRQHHIGTEHLLLALLRPGPDTGLAHNLLTATGLRHDQVAADVTRLADATEPLGAADAAALEAIGIDLEAVKAKLEENFGPGALTPPSPPARRGLFGRRRATPTSPGHIPFTPRAKVVLELSLREALRLKHRHIGTEHILLGLIREGRGLAARILTDHGIDLPDLRTRTEQAAAGTKTA
ncbi:hypothetical protein GCM10009679_63780 [Saccharothrix algeriensis]|uniref:Clp R domain-containing protein n=1 Tax=Catellatospora bangladeshensis TaxID=310355 RepID=A0A8J3JGJ2_9ACTN|nr:Clp protease N-terminal domain-containing protein [Catellatospora bangladeshensis]GIF80273.1 hypothetical protein Cba03nite_16220 [Catellatospora bangladeshensis]